MNYPKIEFHIEWGLISDTDSLYNREVTYEASGVSIAKSHATNKLAKDIKMRPFIPHWPVQRKWGSWSKPYHVIEDGVITGIYSCIRQSEDMTSHDLAGYFIKNMGPVEDLLCLKVPLSHYPKISAYTLVCWSKTDYSRLYEAEDKNL